MRCAFLLSGDYPDLGKEEAISVIKVVDYRLTGRLMFADFDGDLPYKLLKRLALTKNICRILFECRIEDLTDNMKRFDWNSVYEKDFCLRIYNFNKENPITEKSIKKIKNKKNDKIKKYSEKELAGYVWRSVNNPKVNLQNPKTLIQMFIIKSKVYCGLLIYENKEDFESRKAHLRPFPHPSSLHPKVARALVNISGIKEDEILLDPFCGTGGFLIEAGLMKTKSIGYDINKMMIDGCKENLKYFNIKNFKIKNKNALSITDKFDYAVTDLPYGLNSNAMAMYEKDWKKHRINKKVGAEDFIENLEKFYLKFLKNLRKILKKKAIIVFPSYVGYKELLKKSKFKIEFEFENYVHRSLKREIIKIS